MHRHVAVPLLAGVVVLTAACGQPGARTGSQSARDTAGATGTSTRASDPAGTAEPSADTAISPSVSVPPLDTAVPVPERAEAFYGGFAYADGSGGQLLAVTELSHPDLLFRAICQSGRRLAVGFERHQPRSENDDSRQGSGNFHRDEGDLFRVDEGAARGDETCFLLGPALLALGPRLLPRHPTDARCDPADSTRLTEAKARPVVSCSRIRVVDDGTHVLAAVFEPRGDSALASLILADPSRLTFLDFPGEREAHGDTWRVGDGGEFHPEDFDVLFVINGPAARAMAVAWAAEEGESLRLALALDGAPSFEEAVGGYRYLMPY